MKLIALALVTLALVGCATKYDAPKLVAPVRAAVAKAQVKVASAQAHVSRASTAIAELEAKLPAQTPELHSLAQQAKVAVETAGADLVTAAEELRTAQLKTSTLEGTVGKLANEKAILERRYGKLKFGLCTLAAAGALYLLFQFRWILAFAGPYAWIAFVAGPAAAFGLLWKLIDWVL